MNPTKSTSAHETPIYVEKINTTITMRSFGSVRTSTIFRIIRKIAADETKELADLIEDFRINQLQIKIGNEERIRIFTPITFAAFTKSSRVFNHFHRKVRLSLKDYFSNSSLIDKRYYAYYEPLLHSELFWVGNEHNSENVRSVQNVWESVKHIMNSCQTGPDLTNFWNVITKNCSEEKNKFEVLKSFIAVTNLVEIIAEYLPLFPSIPSDVEEAYTNLASSR